MKFNLTTVAGRRWSVAIVWKCTFVTGAKHKAPKILLLAFSYPLYTQNTIMAFMFSWRCKIIFILYTLSVGVAALMTAACVLLKKKWKQRKHIRGRGVFFCLGRNNEADKDREGAFEVYVVWYFGAHSTTSKRLFNPNEAYPTALTYARLIGVGLSGFWCARLAAPKTTWSEHDSFPYTDLYVHFPACCSLVFRHFHVAISISTRNMKSNLHFMKSIHRSTIIN